MQKLFTRIPVVFWIGLATVIVVVGGLVVVLQTQKGMTPSGGQAKSAKLLAGVQEFESQGAVHINPGTTHPAYNSNPPTSGWHYSQPAAWGIYENQIVDGAIIHSLEHGGIWIAYKPNLPDDEKAKLKEIASRYKSKVILEPRVQNDSPIALAAWQRLLKLDQVDEAKITEFISTYKNRGPERVPD